MHKNRPVVLSFSGHDPSGGAGVQADIEALASHRCHACSVVTALTEQDSRNVKKLLPQSAQDVVDQARTLFSDFPIAAVKIGLIGHHETAEAIHTVLSEHSQLPVVLDPVLAAGGGKRLGDDRLVDAVLTLLLPQTTVLTPNSEEARKLAKDGDLDLCGRRLQGLGADFVLITGTHEQSDQVHNRLYMAEDRQETYNWQRLPESYHGSGCTLASTIAALIAHGLDPLTAITEAQEYTWLALQSAYRPGKGQFNPDRLFWLEETS